MDPHKAEHAFGAAGVALVAVANRLCESLADHWLRESSPEDWKPPFEGAQLARVTEFTAQNAESAVNLALGQHSTLHALLSAYEVPMHNKPSSIVERVKRVVRQNVRDKHLAPRFSRALNVGDDALPLKVDFLGQHFACYFVQATSSERGIEASAERAYGKLFELQALRGFVGKRRKSLGLLDDEKPEHFELLVVGSRQHPVQRRAIAQIEALADRGQVIARPVEDVSVAAARVVEMERRAA